MKYAYLLLFLSAAVSSLAVGLPSPALADHNVSHDSTTDWTDRYNEQNTRILNVATSTQLVAQQVDELVTAVENLEINGGTSTSETNVETQNLADALDRLTFAVGWAVLAFIFSLGILSAWKLWM